MRVHRRGLNGGERWPCTERELRTALDPDVVEWASFGCFGRAYEAKYSKLRRELEGPVVAHGSCSAGKPGYVCLHVIATDAYSEWASRDFVQNVLPKMVEWMRVEASSPETAPKKRSEFVVEWAKDGHRIHVVSGGVGRHRA